jgi:hypothetical protein
VIIRIMPQSGNLPEHLIWADFGPEPKLVALADHRPARFRIPAAARNVGPIVRVLSQLMPPAGMVLEIASGAGQHIATLAVNRPELSYQPSDRDPFMHPAIAAWSEDSGMGNLYPPISLDVQSEGWWREVERPVAAMFCSNLIHISPWQACLGLVAGAGALLPAGAPLALYGPFKRSGRHTAPSNEVFDSTLRAQNRSWGVRDLDDVADAGDSSGLDLTQIVNMPSNNLIVVFRRRSDGREDTSCR